MYYQSVFEYGEAKLVFRPDTSNYYIYYYRPGTRRVHRTSTRTSDLEEAKRRLIDHVDSRGGTGPRKPHELPILEVLCDYMEKDGPVDFRRYAVPAAFRVLTEFVESHGVTFISELTLDTQDRFIAWRRDGLISAGHTGSNGTIKRELGVLKAAVRLAWKRGRLTHVPYIRTLPSPPPRPRYLSEAEARSLVAAATEPHVRLYLLLSLHTAQRPRSILELRTAQVDFTANRIDFRRPGEPEHNKRRPVVPITPTLRGPLSEAVSASRSGHVIEYRGRPVRSMQHSFRTARERAGLGRDVTPNVLRHTSATLMAARGVPMRQISGMLGHSHSRTTELYAKHSPDFLGHAVSTLDDLFGGEQPRLPPPRQAPNDG